MGLTKSLISVTNISDLSDTPNATEGLTPAQLKARFDKADNDNRTYINSVLTAELDTALALKAPLASPTFTGTVVLPSTTSIGNVSATELAYLDGAKSNVQTQLDTGWSDVTDSWAYASATTITVPAGALLKYRKGDRVRLTQTTVKYFVVVGVADTVLTVTGGSDYTVDNAAISAISISHTSSPVGFPAYFNWTATPSNLTVGAGGTLTTRFEITNNIVTYSVLFVFGTGSAVGTVPSISLPINPTVVSPNNIEILDSGTAVYYGIMIATLTGGLVFKRYDGVAITATAPMTWATNDSFYGTGCYFI